MGYHIDTWDQKETFINYLNKEMLLKSLLGDIPGQRYSEGNDKRQLFKDHELFTR